MVEQFVLQEIMELNLNMSSMNINEENVVPIEVDKVCNGDDSKALTKVAENGGYKVRRSLRKRIHPLDKRDLASFSVKIQRLSKDMSNVEKLYLSKKVKRLPSTLETIFEEPKQLDNQQQYISSRKFKRSIKFDQDAAATSKLKVKKRQLKAKKLPFSKGYLNRKKVSMDVLLKKLSSIESDNE